MSDNNLVILPYIDLKNISPKEIFSIRSEFKEQHTLFIDKIYNALIDGAKYAAKYTVADNFIHKLDEFVDSPSFSNQSLKEFISVYKQRKDECLFALENMDFSR